MHDFEEMQFEAERLDTANSGGNENDVLEKYVMFPPRDGVVAVRILPPVKGGRLFCSTRIHRINDRNVHCPRELPKGAKHYQGDCELCAYYNYLWKLSEEDGLSEDEKKRRENFARKYKPNDRYYYNCIVREYKNPKSGQIEVNAGPKILSIGKRLNEKIVRAFVGNPKFKQKPLGDVSDVEKGRDFNIIKQMVQSGRDEWANYDQSTFDEPSPAGTKEQVAGWLATLHDLQALRVLKPKDELEKILALHLGAVKPEKNNFDIGKYQRMGDQLKVQEYAAKLPSVEEQVKTEVARHEAAAASTDTSLPAELSENDFFAKVNKMVNK